jgi:hypothetical protein
VVFEAGPPDFTGLSLPFPRVAGANGRTAFVGRLAFDGPDSGATRGIWLADDGGLEPLALTRTTGALGPGAADGSIFQALNQLALTDDGTVLFEATAGPADFSSGKTGVWAARDGELARLISVGDAVAIAPTHPAALKTVASILWNSAEGFDALQNQVAVRLTFTDGGSGVFAFGVRFPDDYLAGDFNLDELLTNADIQAMLDALVDLDGYRSAHGLSEADLRHIGDLDGGGQVTNSDIQAMLDLLTGQSGQSVADISLEVFGSASCIDAYAAQVPEPQTLGILGMAGTVFVALRRARRAS